MLHIRACYIYGLHYVIDIDLGDIDTATSGVSGYMVRVLDDLFTRFVYALKFLIRSESPRDYVDILLSMKHQPNITIVDVANLVAAHGNRRKKEMFSPHNGMLVDPTSENVERAKTHQLDISLDWLNSAHETANQQPTGHPITG